MTQFVTYFISVKNWSRITHNILYCTVLHHNIPMLYTFNYFKPMQLSTKAKQST